MSLMRVGWSGGRIAARGAAIHRGVRGCPSPLLANDRRCLPSRNVCHPTERRLRPLSLRPTVASTLAALPGPPPARRRSPGATRLIFASPYRGRCCARLICSLLGHCRRATRLSLLGDRSSPSLALATPSVRPALDLDLRSNLGLRPCAILFPKGRCASAFGLLGGFRLPPFLRLRARANRDARS